MLIELLMQDKRRAGRIERCAEGRKDSNRLKAWTKLMINVDSIEQFIEEK